MKVKELIKQLQKLPPEIELDIKSYSYDYGNVSVEWDITPEEYTAGCIEKPYLWLTEQSSEKGRSQGELW